MSGVYVYTYDDFVQAYPHTATEIVVSLYDNSQQQITINSTDLVLYVSSGMVITDPIPLTEFGTFDRLIIILHEDACVTLLDSIENTDRYANLDIVYTREIHCFIKNRANVTYVHNQKPLSMLRHKSALSFYVEDFASLKAYTLQTGGKDTQHAFNIFLQGLHAHAILQGAFLLRDAYQNSLVTKQYHQNEHTQSDINIRGIIAHEARGIYHGTITIHENARESDAYQENKNMLVGTLARVVSTPVLEVITDEVHCGHASAVGRIDEQQLFYLMARGIGHDKAYQILLESFCYDVVGNIDNGTACSILQHGIQAYINELVL